MKTQTYKDPCTGLPIPAKYVSRHDKLRDATAKAIFVKWTKFEKDLIALKQWTGEQIDRVQESARADSGVKSGGGEKGNFQFRDFAGEITISKDVQIRTEFDEHLKTAQELITKALAEMAEGSNTDLAAIAQAAFTPRRTGRLDMVRIRQLCTLKVNNVTWNRAVEIIRSCERGIASREYIRVARRNEPNKEPVPIRLDIAAL